MTDSTARGWQKSLLAAGLVGAAASLVIAAADIIYAYIPGSRSTQPELYFQIPRVRLFIGAWLGLVALPFVLPGYWFAARCLKPVANWIYWTVFALAAYAIIFGGATHVSFLFWGLAGQAAASSPEAHAAFTSLLSTYKIQLGLLYIVPSLGILLFSVGFAIATLTGRGLLPRWTAALNPILLMLVISALGYVIPVVGPFIATGAGTLAHAIFFGVCAAVFRRRLMDR